MWQKQQDKRRYCPSLYMTHHMPQDIKQQCKATFYCLRILYESAGKKYHFRLYIHVKHLIWYKNNVENVTKSLKNKNLYLLY